MARPRKHWIVTRTSEYTPNGVLQVGQILADPFDPASALHPGGPLRVPPGVTIEHSVARDVTISQAHEASAVFEIHCRLSGVLAGLGSDTTMQNAQGQNFQFQEVLTRIITPSNEYVDQSLRHGDVPRKLKGRLPHIGRLYMVTGVRVAKGAWMRSASTQNVTASANANLDLAGSSVPVQLGVNAEAGRRTSEHNQLTPVSDHVYAYRLHRIFYFGTSTTKPRPYLQGHVCSYDDKLQAQTYASDSEAEGDYDDFELMYLDERDYDGEDDENVAEVAVPGFSYVFVLTGERQV
ncbi:hypothetical protein VFPPC_00154 [Pochonia chlamydosporia 170]|uniref:Uncharacterized protein n=1 Tax=Pochonia chlamydosporia 170 TaxID=1380566 RepID=A0A179G2L3_METCM|nr:hypothetical protein VFPPC_00154 [Pochonia chlamydosporia 170]OAQ72105.1 hypothetical protein VFPPC_00154 [Pochonia chlamydosporia 170]